FQAEDGIRDFHVTGVQTCALPISHAVEDGPGQFDPLFALFVAADAGHGLTDGNGRVGHAADDVLVGPHDLLDLGDPKTRDRTDDHMFFGEQSLELFQNGGKLTRLHREDQDVTIPYGLQVVRAHLHVAVFAELLYILGVSFGQVHAGGTVRVQYALGHGQAEISGSYDRYFHLFVLVCSMVRLVAVWSKIPLPLDPGLGSAQSRTSGSYCAPPGPKLP